MSVKGKLSVDVDAYDWEPLVKSKKVAAQDAPSSPKYDENDSRNVDLVDYVFYSALATLDKHKKEFTGNSPWRLDKLNALLDRISPEDREKMKELNETDDFYRRAEIIKNLSPQTRIHYPEQYDWNDWPNGGLVTCARCQFTWDGYAQHYCEL